MIRKLGWCIALIALGGVAGNTHAQVYNHGSGGEREALLAFFAQLEGGEWHGEGTWSGGSAKFVQVHSYQRGLDGRIVRSHTQIPDSAGMGLTVRAEGIRAWDAAAEVMRFWEFDREGGITTGTVGLRDGALFYEYPYAVGGRAITLRDEWRPLTDGTYEYRIGVWQDGAWGQTYVSATFRRR
jgi:hypothetical protein